MRSGPQPTSVKAHDERLIARHSVRHYSWALLIGLAGGVISHVLGFSRGGSVAIALLVAAGPHALLLVRRGLDQGEVLRIDSAGVLDHRLKVGTIPWREISHVERQRGRLFIAVKDPDALGLNKTVWARMNQPLGQEPGVLVGLGGLDVRADRIVEAVTTRLSGSAPPGGGKV